MSHSWHHAMSSARKFGGEPENYIEIHNWFDASKEIIADPPPATTKYCML